MADTYTTSELIDLVNELRKENEDLKKELKSNANKPLGKR